MDSRRDWCERVEQRVKDLAQAIVKDCSYREEERKAEELWDLLKVELEVSCPRRLLMLGREISKLAREKERKRILFFVKM
jgi:hypothetical protein